MSVYSIYFTNQKGQQRDSVYTHTPQSPIKIAKSSQRERESVYNNQIMQKALLDSCKKSQDLRANSPTFKVTDTINQNNYDTPIQKSCVKRGIFSGIDTLLDPQRNIHVSHNSSNDQIMMYREDRYLKKYAQKQKDISQEKDWKSCIKVYKQEIRQDSDYKRLRKAVNASVEVRNPILSPKETEQKRLRVPCSIKFEQRQSVECIRTYNNRNNESNGFKNSQKLYKQLESPKMNIRDNNTFKSEVKNLLKNHNVQKFSNTDYKGCQDNKKSKKYCIKVDYPRPTSAFVL